VDPLFLERWTNRSFTGEPITEDELMVLLEAARWAPSAFNIQPWRFVWARRDTAAWPNLLGLLSPFNQNWARHAAALVVLVSDSMDRRDPSAPRALHSHTFDTGAAWAQLGLQAHRSGWSACCMTGLDMKRAREVLNVPADHRVEAAVAVGRAGPQPQLSDSFAQSQVPSDRRPLSETAFEGALPRL
jgi:nitroreductase